MTVMNQQMNVPLIDRVDWLITGGSAAGVAAAVALAEAGQTVMVAAPRSYLGEDIAGAFRYWDRVEPDHDTPLGRRLFGADCPPTPMQVKLSLERALLEAGVRVVLTTCPTGLICDEQGRARGVVLANRAGQQAVLAGGLIDASMDGELSRIAGHPGFTPTGKQDVTHVTLCHEAGAAAPGIAAEDLPGFSGLVNDKPFVLSARRYRLTVDFGDGSASAWARAQAEVTRRCWVPQEYLHQETLEFVSPPSKNADEADAIEQWPADHFELQPGVYTLSPRGATPATAINTMRRPCVALWLGGRLGSAIARRQTVPVEPTSSLRVRCAGSQPVDTGELRTLAFALRPSATPPETLTLGSAGVPKLGRYGVLVIGGGTGGAPAAIAAAQAGASVGLVETGPALGGVGTLGQITKYWFGNRDGFTRTIDEGVRSMEYREQFKKADGSWSVSAKQAWFHRRCHELGVTMWLGTQAVGLWMGGNRVRGVVIAGPRGIGLIEADAVIDATGGADLPAAAGAETVVVGADHAAVQGTGLAGMEPGREYHNSDHSFSDDTDVADTTAFFISSRRKFANHFDVGQLIDSRERRQIVGRLVLDPVDILYNRRFPDTICVATSNFDSHGYTTHPLFMLEAPSKRPLSADVPFRCLMPEGLRGMLVTGLAVSAHRDALPVIRMQADVQNQGYAAGYAAAMASQRGVDITEIDVSALQRHLVDIGALPARVLTDRDSFPVEDHTLAHAVAHGLDDPASLALILADAQRARLYLRREYDQAIAPDVRLRYASILAFTGDNYGEATLLEHVQSTAWDKGWNYRGMGQFGRSLSCLDADLIALGQVGRPRAWKALLEKADQLCHRAETTGALPEFSHCRALAHAFEDLMARHPDPRATQALSGVLALTGMAGHAWTELDQVLGALTDDPNENGDRNRALRELYLARAIFRCGDHDDRGRRTLQAYANDLRGHFARHARANLDRGPLSAAPTFSQKIVIPPRPRPAAILDPA
ncbi:MAG: FAD-dependent oxidoreductase [Planctomycetota bacterium]